MSRIATAPTEAGPSSPGRWRTLAPTLLVLLAGFLPLALAPLRARYLGPAGRGEFAYFQAAVMVVTAAAGGGIRHAYYGQDRVGERRGELWTARLWLAALVLGALAGVPLAATALVSLGPVVAAGVLVITVGAPLSALVQLEMAEAQLVQRQYRVAGLTSVPAVVEFVANVALLLARSLTVASAISVTIGSELTRGVAAAVYHRRDGRSASRPARDAVASAALAKRALQYLPATLVPLVAANVDALVYGALGHSSPLGVYSVAKLVPTFLLLVASVWEGQFLALVEKRGVVAASVALLVPLTALGAVAAAAGSFLVEPLFGGAFAAARSAFPVTAGVGLVAALYVWFVALCAKRRMRRVSIVSSGITLTVCLVGAVLVSSTGTPSPTVMGLPVLTGYSLGLAAIIAALLRARGRQPS